MQTFVDLIFSLYFESKVIKQTLKQKHFLVLPTFREFLDNDELLLEKK
jgi:hypothetical protein